MIPVLELTRPLVLTDVETTPGIVVETVDGWTRPPDWLPLPDVTSAENKFVGLYAVFAHGRNTIALQATITGAATYVVDWGDGTVETVTSATVAQHVYDFATLPASSLSSRGYKQVVVTVTPSEGGSFLAFGLNYRATGERTVNYAVGWLDIIASLPSVTNLGSFAGGGTVQAGLLERVDFRHTTAVCGGFTSSFRNCPRLRVFRYAGGIGNVGSFSSMFQGCSGLERATLSGISTTCTSLASVFSTCASLVEVTIEGVVTSVTSVASMVSNCSMLRRLTLPTTTWAALTTTTAMFSQVVSLQIFIGTPPKVTFDVSQGNMFQAELEALLDALLTVTGQTITITGHPGAAAAAAGASGVAAVAKGWTIVA